MAKGRPPIPAGTKREVRQRCGFGCVLCGEPFYDIDHITPYAESQAHDPDNLTLLCDRHHDEKSRGLLPVEVVRKANAEPHNRRRSTTTPYMLRYSGSQPRVLMGGNAFQSNHPTGLTALVIDNRPLLRFRRSSDALLLDIRLMDDQNNNLLVVRENELVVSTGVYDLEVSGRSLTVRTGSGRVDLEVSFEPPTSVTVQRASFKYNGVDVLITRDRIAVPGASIKVFGSLFSHPVGIAIGERSLYPRAALVPEPVVRRTQSRPADPA